MINSLFLFLALMTPYALFVGDTEWFAWTDAHSKCKWLAV